LPAFNNILTPHPLNGREMHDQVKKAGEYYLQPFYLSHFILKNSQVRSGKYWPEGKEKL